MEIISSFISEKEALYMLDIDSKIVEVVLKFDLEENWEPRFNPGSYLGFDERMSGHYPIDIEFSVDLPEEIQKELEDHLGETYDCT